MNKLAENQNFHKSSFTATFAIELLGIDVWHDCNEGWLDLGPCSQGIRIQYQLYPGQNFDLDVLVWPHCAKIWCGGQQYGWVRTWQYLERRWLTFTVRHAFPVRIVELRNFVASVIPAFGLGSLGSIAKNDKNFEVYLPALRFGEKRYFGRVTEVENEPLNIFIRRIIFQSLMDHIPSSFLDGQFDVPQVVSDVRHQDAVFNQVQLLTLNNKVSEESIKIPETEDVKGKDKKLKSPVKKSNEALKTKYELRLTGDAILSGTGRIIPFEVIGNQPAELGEVVALISSNNLPAQDDLPMVFINIDDLIYVPVEEFKKAGIEEVYARWTLGDEVRCTQPQSIRNKSEIHLNDHHAVPFEYENTPKIVADFLDNPFEIELLGTRKTFLCDVSPKFFEREVESNKVSRQNPAEYDNEVLIAICRVDASELSNRANTVIQGEFPVYPLKEDYVTVNREATCTNDINAVRAVTKPGIVVQPYVVLEAQMTLQVAIGYVGCISKKLKLTFSRLYCIVSTEASAKCLVEFILEINKTLNDIQEIMVTGFALDTGSEVLIFVEGPAEKDVIEIWKFTEKYYQDMEIWFSTKARYSTRLYESALTELEPFMILKMHVPLSSLLSCPTVYVRTALPLPARAAVLKLGRLLALKFQKTPCSSEMPTISELQSFILELCSPLRPSLT